MFTPDDIKDYIIYEIEPTHLCELLGDSLQEIVLMMKRDRKLMTPKETAKELYHKFQVYEVNGQKHMQYGPQVKVFTLIAVDEILNILVGIYDYDHEILYPYWQEVKQEIEKL